jgi:hypothetical protein
MLGSTLLLLARVKANLAMGVVFSSGEARYGGSRIPPT